MQARVPGSEEKPFRKHRVVFYRERANVSHFRARVGSGVKSSLAVAISRCHLIGNDFGEQLTQIFIITINLCIFFKIITAIII